MGKKLQAQIEKIKLQFRSINYRKGVRCICSMYFNNIDTYN